VAVEGSEVQVSFTDSVLMMRLLRTKDIELVVLSDPFAIDEGILNEKALVLKLLSTKLANGETQ
jgi:hypothetical protein